MVYTLKHQEKGECLKCGTVIYGRADKKFCSPACKNAYHNDSVSGHRRARNKAIRTLNVNYDILDKLMKNEIRSISIERIRDLGFDENYSTGHRIGRTRHEEESCFDITYCRTETKIFQIRRTL